MTRHITFFALLIVAFIIVVSLLDGMRIPECWEDEIVVKEVSLGGTYHCVAVDDLDHGYRP